MKKIMPITVSETPSIECLKSQWAKMVLALEPFPGPLERENPYQAVSIPKDALEKIKKHIQQYEYKNIADFIRIAIESKIDYDRNIDEKLDAPHKLKPTAKNLQKQIIELQKDIFELKHRRIKIIF